MVDEVRQRSQRCLGLFLVEFTAADAATQRLADLGVNQMRSVAGSPDDPTAQCKTDGILDTESIDRCRGIDHVVSHPRSSLRTSSTVSLLSPGVGLFANVCSTIAIISALSRRRAIAIICSRMYDCNDLPDAAARRRNVSATSSGMSRT